VDLQVTNKVGIYSKFASK